MDDCLKKYLRARVDLLEFDIKNEKDQGRKKLLEKEKQKANAAYDQLRNIEIISAS